MLHVAMPGSDRYPIELPISSADFCHIVGGGQIDSCTGRSARDNASGEKAEVIRGDRCSSNYGFSPGHRNIAACPQTMPVVLVVAYVSCTKLSSAPVTIATVLA